jgi:hemoglobin/transferrin/lactoferrin receptor protein
MLNLRLTIMFPVVFYVAIINAHQLQGAQNDLVETLNLSVTATRVEVPVKRLPNSVKILKNKDFVERQQAQSIPEALGQQSGVLLQKTSRGHGSPFIRGFTGFRNLFLIDGIRFNNSVMRDGPNQYWNTVDLFAMDRLELVKGSTSVLYGSDAIGGTINALTRDLLIDGNDDVVRARMLNRFASAEDTRIQRGEVVGRYGKNFAILLGGTRKSYGDIRAGAETGLQPKTGFEERSFDMKAQAKISPRDEIKLAWQKSSQEDVWRTHSTIYGRSYRGSKVGSDKRRSSDQSRELAYVKHKHIFETGFLTNIEYSLSYQRQQEDALRTKSDLTTTDQGFDVHTPGVALQAQSDLESGRWTYGVETYRDLVDSTRLNFRSDGSFDSKSIQGPVGDDATYDNLGIYVQDQYKTSKDLELTVGVRHNEVSADIERFQDPATKKEARLSKKYSSTVGSLRASYDATKDGQGKLFAGVSQGFRAPNLSDLTRFDVARSNEVEVPSADLSPEHYLSYEIGSRWGDEELWQVEAWIFRTDIKNMIIRAPSGVILPDGDVEVTKKNAGRGYIQGAEVEGFLRLTEFYSVGGNYTFHWGDLEAYPTSESQTKREPLSRVMPATLNLNARIESQSEGFWAEVLYTLVRRQDRLSASDRLDSQRIPPGGSPGYKTYSLRAGGAILNRAKLSLALENILNEDYRVLGSGVNEPGRNFVVTIDARF